MKKFLLILLLQICLFSAMQAQQKNIAKQTDVVSLPNAAYDKQQKGVVTNVTVYASPGYAKGCTNDVKHFEFTAAITTNGPCTVNYRWERNDGARDGYAPRTITFASAGTQMVTQTWDLSPAEYEGWLAVTVTAPNTITSNKAPFTISCCKEGNGGNNCKENPYTLTPCSENLLASFKNLAANMGVRNCHPTLNYPTVTGRMPEDCFGLQAGSAANVTYSVFNAPGSSEWRVIWGSTPGNFSYYGACAPSPIEFPHPGVIENHVFAAKLIRQSDYRAFSGSPKAYSSMGSVPTINVADVVEIMAVRLEENGGYISATEAADYNSVYSSKGIVVTVKLRDGSSPDCYIINNYDGAGTINWKMKNKNCK